MDILQKLYQNSGLIHVAENVVQFMDNSTVAGLRLVSKETNEFLTQIWQDRHETWRNNALAEARKLCQMKFDSKKRNQEGAYVQTSIFEKWPHWETALDEMNSKQIKAATFLLNEYMGVTQAGSPFGIGSQPVGTCSPLHYAVEQSGITWQSDRSIWAKLIDILIHTSLDFNSEDDRFGDTILLNACNVGSRECVEVLLNNADKKGIDINAINRNGNSIVHEAILNDEEFPEKPVLNLLFERRKEFDFNLSQDILFLASSDQIGRVETFELMCEWAYEKRINFGAVDPGGNTILHLACQLKPDLAVFMLENVSRYGSVYGFDRDLIASMANAKNNAQLRPIDIIGSYEHFRQYWGRGGDCHKILTTELKKYTSFIE